jgi:hypothetical protein
VTNAGKASVCLCLFLLAGDNGDDEDDDEGVMCWLNGHSSPIVFLLFFCFVGCLSFVLLPSFSFFLFSPLLSQ